MKLSISSFIALTALILASCGGPKRKPGRTYMPDMAYSRAYETYPNLDTSIFTENEAAAGDKIYYDRKPVPGTVKRDQLMVYHGTDDTLSFAAAKTVTNPVADTLMTKTDWSESERLYNVYCGICHGGALDGTGPISKKWAGTPANLAQVDKFGRAIYPDGQLFHTITYGKGQMGSYASQLNVKQRWMVVNYIRSKQKGKETAATPAKGAASDTVARIP